VIDNNFHGDWILPFLVVLSLFIAGETGVSVYMMLWAAATSLKPIFPRISSPHVFHQILISQRPRFGSSKILLLL